MAKAVDGDVSERRRRARRRVRGRRVLRPLAQASHPARSRSSSARAPSASRPSPRLRRPWHRADHRRRTTTPSVASWPETVRRPRRRRPRRAIALRRRARGAGRTRSCRARASIFECVGAPGLIQKIVESVRDGHPDLLRRRLVHRRHPRHHRGDPQGRDHPVRRRPASRRTGTAPSTPSRRGGSTRCPASARSSRSTRCPTRSTCARKSEGPPRIVVHPNGDVA